MPKIKEVLIEALIPVIKAVGKKEMQSLLSGIKANNSDIVYKKILQSIYSDFSLLKEVALKSKTKIDDGILDLVLEAITEHAAPDGIEMIK